MAATGENFLLDELVERASSSPIVFRIPLQLAGSEDIVDDATVHWPEDRPLADFGRIARTAPVSESGPAQKQIIFDPIPRVDGICSVDAGAGQPQNSEGNP